MPQIGRPVALCALGNHNQWVILLNMIITNIDKKSIYFWADYPTQDDLQQEKFRENDQWQQTLKKLQIVKFR